jgi:signal transduction histidine kinase
MLFEPTISFKARGMGLGLAISRKNALLAGGDLAAIDGRLGGAAFRLTIPCVQARPPVPPDRPPQQPRRSRWSAYRPP